MAFTVSQVVSSTVWGNMRVAILDVTPDAVAGDFAAGVGALYAVIPSLKSMASYVNSGSTRNIGSVKENVGATGTAIVGQIAITGCIANDVYRLICLSKA